MLVPNSITAAACTCTAVLQQLHQKKTYYPYFRYEKMGYREVVPKTTKASSPVSISSEQTEWFSKLMQALQEIKANKSRGFYSANEDLRCQSRLQLHLALSEILVCPKDHKNHRNESVSVFLQIKCFMSYFVPLTNACEANSSPIML